MSPQEPRTSWHVRQFLRTHNLPGEVLEFPQPTRTVEEAARVLGVEPARIIKTLLFLVRKEPHLVIAAGTTRVSYRALAQHLGVSRKKIRLATPEEVLAWTGYPVGAVPPIGLPHAYPTLLDETILAYEEVYGGGGSPNALLRIPTSILRKQTRARVVSLIEPSS